MRETTNYKLTLFDDNDKANYLVNYNGDNSKIDDAIYGVSTVADSANQTATEAETKVDSALVKIEEFETELDTLTGKVNTNIVNIDKSIVQGVGFYTHTKIGTEHFLTSNDGLSYSNIRFKATAGFIVGDTVYVNNVLVTTITLNGKLLPTNFFMAGSNVLCLFSTGLLTFTGYYNEVVEKVIGGTRVVQLSAVVPLTNVSGSISLVPQAALETYFGAGVSVNSCFMSVTNGDYLSNTFRPIFCYSNGSSLVLNYDSGQVGDCRMNMLITCTLT